MIRRSLLGVKSQSLLIATFNISRTNSATTICYESSKGGFNKMWIDGVEQEEVVSSYSFRTTGNHTVEYSLTDETTLQPRAFTSCYQLKNIQIPNCVTTIGQGAFGVCSGLTSITIPKSVASIGMDVFYQCYSLTSCTFEEGCSITALTSNLFYSCSALTNVNIPTTVTTIGAAFIGCNSLRKLNDNDANYECNIPNHITAIESRAFDGCLSFKSLYVPDSVTSIGLENPWEDCSGLTSITVSNSNTDYDSRNGCNAIIETSTKRLVSGCRNTVIPNTVTKIGECAFNGCIGLPSMSMTIPNSVEDIDDHAFRSCNGLTGITIPNSVETLSWGCFAYCHNLKMFNSSTNGVFDLSNFNYVGIDCFRNCYSLTEINFGNKINRIEYAAFSYCTSLTSINIPSSVTYLGNSPFAGCSGVTSITVNSNNTVYDSRNNCNAIIETSTNEINTACKNTVIPNTITSIGYQAYFNVQITSITIPNSVIAIGKNLFGDTSTNNRPKEIISYCTTAPTIYDDTFRGVDTGGTLYVPRGSSGYNVWMQTSSHYLGSKNWTKVEQ